MSKIIKIYCEGKKGSHDYDVLEKVAAGLDAVLIEPIGSVRGAASVIQFKESEIVKSDFKLLFRDRDFDVPIPSYPLLEQDPFKKYVFYSYRNTIENYLFDVEPFFSFLKEEKLSTKYGVSKLEDAKVKLIQAAKHIMHYQAVRHALGKMRTAETNFGTKWTDKSGDLPDSLDECYCKEQAIAKISYAKSLTESWTEDGFNKVYEDFLHLFNDDFMDNLLFLVYFQGKDYASSLKAIMKDFPIGKYYKYAKQHFDYTRHPDLMELRRLLENNM